MRDTTHVQPIKKDYLLIFAIAAGTLLVFSRAFTQGFVNYDDASYVYQNPHVLGGLSFESIRWAFQIDVPVQWHPLTYNSYMIDASLDRLFFGSENVPHAWIYKTHNVLLHIISSVMLFIFLRRTTDERYRYHAFVVACLFAWHPVNVESVAWIAERKNTLSVMLWMATMLAYVGYQRKGGWGRYLGVTLLMLMAMLAKSMAVTLPAVLMLMDVWPGRRVQSLADKPPSAFGSQVLPIGILGRGYVVEKLPWFAASIAVGLIIMIHHSHTVSLLSTDQQLPVATYVNRVFTWYGMYLPMLVMPVNLSVLYANPPGYPQVAWPIWMPVFGALALAMMLVTGWIHWKRAPAILIGVLWYMGTLVPVVGIIPINTTFSGADRNLYIPAIGLFIALVYGLAEFLPRTGRQRAGPRAQAIVAAAAMVGCVALSARQVTVWDNSGTLFTRQIEAGQPHWAAYANRAAWHAEAGRFEPARTDLAAAVALSPNEPHPYRRYAELLESAGDVSGAMTLYEQAERAGGRDINARIRIAEYFRDRGHLQESMTWHIKALELDADHAEAHLGIARILTIIGDARRAAEHLTQAEIRLQADLATSPGDAGLNLAMAEVCILAGRLEEAIEYTKRIDGPPTAMSRAAVERGTILRAMSRPAEAEAAYRDAVALDPTNAAALNILGVVLAEKGDLAAAAELFEKAVRLKPSFVEAYDNLERARQKLADGSG